VLFEELFGLRDNIGGIMQSLIPEDANIFINDDGVIDYIRTNPNIVGVVIKADDPNGVTTLSINGITPGSEGYMGQREIVLFYNSGNAEAVAFVELLQSGAFDKLFSDNNVSRIR
jgi:hypothetical protein